ncbi:MAG TPA: hypothetical protein PLL33_03955 [Paracoccus sp. (in: a-proteobacteria)]|nr:hypothetical protein [Paracoccus sp. (in: a-proteobacteria)]
MSRGIVFCLALLALSACRYESTADLRSSTTPYRVTGAFAEGQYLFQASDQNSILVLDVAADQARIAWQDQGQSVQRTTLVSILGSDAFPERTYVAVALGGVDRNGAQTFHYYPFSFNETQIEWLKPAQVTEVFGLADLARHVTAAVQGRNGQVFDLVPVKQQMAVLTRFEAWRNRNAGKSAAPAPAAPPMIAGEPTVKGFSVGDGVYVKGFFSDKPSIIQQIDEANRRVKVRRHDDGVSEWVGYERIITRDESTANNVGRTVVTFGVLVCMLSPETCTDSRK